MVRIRQSGVDDADRIAAVYVRSWLATYRELLPDDALPTMDTAAWAARHRSPLEQGRTTLLAWDDGTPVGMISFGPDREDPSLNEVYALYVLPERQGRGVGRGLMDAALAVLGPAEVGLWCAVDNQRSCRFYENYGFVVQGRTGTYTIGSVELTTVRYSLPAGATAHRWPSTAS